MLKIQNEFSALSFVSAIEGCIILKNVSNILHGEGKLGELVHALCCEG